MTQEGTWVAARKDYLVPVKALAVIFRGMFLDMLRKALPQERVPNAVWKKPWVVYCKPAVGGSERVLRYLARYVHRVAFANSRLVGIEDGRVTFRYQARGKGRRPWKTMSLPATEFLRRFLQHVLPRRTHKVRYYGIWHPSQRPLLRRIQLATAPAEIPSATEDDGTAPTESPAAAASENRKCPCCSEGTLVLLETLSRRTRAPP